MMRADRQACDQLFLQHPPRGQTNRRPNKQSEGIAAARQRQATNRQRSKAGRIRASNARQRVGRAYRRKGLEGSKASLPTDTLPLLRLSLSALPVFSLLQPTAQLRKEARSGGNDCFESRKPLPASPRLPAREAEEQSASTKSIVVMTLRCSTDLALLVLACRRAEERGTTGDQPRRTAPRRSRTDMTQSDNRCCTAGRPIARQFECPGGLRRQSSAARLPPHRRGPVFSLPSVVQRQEDEKPFVD